MTWPMVYFGGTTLLPAALIVSGAIWGGWWIGGAVIVLTALVSLVDRLVPQSHQSTSFTGDLALPIIIAAAHFLVLPVAIYALTQGSLSPLEKTGIFFATGLWLGQISNANAHELIHQNGRARHRLGMWVYISLLFGHHTSAHRLVHHPYVGTPTDPNTARLGESLYRYLPRAWAGSFSAGYQAEAQRIQRVGKPVWRNPYAVYIGGGLGCIVLVGSIAGPSGIVAYLGLCAYAQIQLLMTDYVQHYGLTRSRNNGDALEPVSQRHSWNSPHWYSSAMLLNATRHSDHHTHPARPYTDLSLADDAPILPRPLPLMASIALIPPLWRQMMDHRVKALRNA